MHACIVHRASCRLDVGIAFVPTLEAEPDRGVKPGGGIRGDGEGGSCRRLIASDETKQPPPKEREREREREKEEGKEELAAPRPSVLVDAIVIWQTAGCMWRQ